MLPFIAGWKEKGERLPLLFRETFAKKGDAGDLAQQCWGLLSQIDSCAIANITRCIFKWNGWVSIFSFSHTHVGGHAHITTGNHGKNLTFHMPKPVQPSNSLISHCPDSRSRSFQIPQSPPGKSQIDWGGDRLPQKEFLRNLQEEEKKANCISCASHTHKSSVSPGVIRQALQLPCCDN